MKVILQQDIRGKGKRGQMIEVSDGYARNYMLPRKLAVEATADNVNTMRMNDKAMQEKLDRRKLVLDEPIKTTGIYTVRCKLGYEITADLRVEIKEQ